MENEKGFEKVWSSESKGQIKCNSIILSHCHFSHIYIECIGDSAQDRMELQMELQIRRRIIFSYFPFNGVEHRSLLMISLNSAYFLLL